MKKLITICIMVVAIGGTIPVQVFAGIVADTPPDRPSNIWPDGIGRVTLSLIDIDQEIVVPNSLLEYYTKHFWMEVVMDTGYGNPQAPGEEINESLWPTVTAIDSESTLTGVASIVDFEHNNWRWYITVDLYPQPSSETVKFPDAWWNGWGSHISSINIETICTIPEPATMLLLSLGGLVLRKIKRT